MADPENRPSTSSQEAAGAAGERPKSDTQPYHDTMTSAPGNDFGFLDPPQGPGELGWLGGYRVLRVLGRGGMGVVFEAEDPQLGRRVALKVPFVETDESYRKRFLREGRLAATLPHEYITAIYQAGQHHDLPFLAMELLRGESLESYLEKHQTLPVAEALRITCEVAQGLQAAHAAGLVHRDVKPANVFLAEPAHGSGPPRVKLLDFGVAREMQPQQGITQLGQIVGSVGYMAPEQLLGSALDGRTDLFALGCLLYRMLFGRLPFNGENTVQMLQAVLNQAPEPTSGTIPPSVQALLDELLQKDPQRRPANAEILVRRLQEIEHELMRPPTVVHGTGLRRLVNAETRTAWGILGGAAVVVAALLIGVIALVQKLSQPTGDTPLSGPPIKVGILYSKSGPLTSTETPVAESTLLAIDEINHSGGVLGRPVEPILADGRSTAQGFAEAAEKLISEEKVVTLFGCWTSSERKAVKEVCEKHDHLLLYPVNYEGLEQSPNIFYVGGGPGQQLIPATGWAVGSLAKHRFYCIGSDYVYSHVANAILRDQFKRLRAECVGEAYVPLSEVRGAEFARIVAKIKASDADAIMSTVDGHDANVAFFHALVEAGVHAEKLPCISFMFFETELRLFDEQDVKGHYAVANYFQSLPGAVNRDFLKRLNAKHPTRVVNDSMEAAYCGVHLWRQAVAEARRVEPPKIRDALRKQKFEGPEGLIRFDPVTQHAIRTARIGIADSNQAFRLVFASPEPLPAEPFPPTRSRAQWEEFLQKLYCGWDNHWERPTP
jgi:urea transport system substrate-binding protein